MQASKMAQQIEVPATKLGDRVAPHGGEDRLPIKLFSVCFNRVL